ncbi:hypothetical protein [Archaeoglobus sp.]
MRYVLVKEGESIRKVEVAEFGEERMLQEMTERHPEVLSIPSSGSIVPLVKEYSVNTGSVDLIAFDESGRIYLIETKLHRNFDKRKALAQLIDYASQIAMHDTFEDFKEKIHRKVGKTLEEIVKERFGENYEQILNRLKTAFDREDFALVLVMDELDAPLKDMILFLNRHSDLSIIGVELRRFVLDEKTEVFVPTVVGVEIPKKGDNLGSPITPEEFIKRYSQAGLGEIAERIIRSFRSAEEIFDDVRIVPTPQYLTLRIRDREIEIYIKADPGGDHGVWVKNRDLYEAIKQIGDNLGLETNIPTDDTTFAKIIKFNGIDGLKKVVDKLDRLIEELVNVSAEME